MPLVLAAALLRRRCTAVSRYTGSSSRQPGRMRKYIGRRWELGEPPGSLDTVSKSIGLGLLLHRFLHLDS